MTIIPPLGTAITRLLPALSRCRGVLFVILAFNVIGAILGRGFFALTTEVKILELAELAAETLLLGLEFLEPLHSPSVNGLPISRLLP